MEEKTRGPTERRVIGLDMHPDIFSAAALRGPHATSAKLDWVHDKVDQRDLEKWAVRHTTETDVIVLEASGNSFAVVSRLAKVDRTALVLESCRAGQIRKAHVNNDKHSAIKLARIYLGGLARVVWVPDEETICRREILSQYGKAVTDDTRARNRIQTWLSNHCLRPTGLPLSRPEVALKRVLRLHDWTEQQVLIIQLMFQSLSDAICRRTKLYSMISSEIGRTPKMLRLMRLMGIGPVTSYAAVAVIGDVRRFPTQKKLVAYVGLCPRVNDSGKGVKRGSISHHGRSDLRSYLVEGAQAFLNHGSGYTHRWAVRLLMRKGKKVAAVAAARKMLIAIYYLLLETPAPIKEVSASIQLKISKMARHLDKDQLKAMGCTRPAQYAQKILTLMQGGT